MKLNLITFASSFQKKVEASIRNSHRELFQALDQAFEVSVIFSDQLQVWPTDGISVVFIATGGTEGLVVAKYHELPHPLTILTDGKANSLAASLELSKWIRLQGDKCRILHGSFNLIINQLQNSESNKLLKGQRIGVIGQPSDWLVASNVDYAVAKEKWGIEYVDIPLAEVENRFAVITDQNVQADAATFLQGAKACVEPTAEEITKAERLYFALSQLVEDYQLNALTLQCFSLISSIGTTGCLALSLLTDHGIPAGCEGDLQSIFTLLYLKRLTGQDAFMANPSWIDTENRQIILAHCTIGLKQTKGYIIRNHFESLSGVAIQGFIPEGPVTVCKMGGKELTDMVAMDADILENMSDPNKCRTQVKIQLKSIDDANYFLTRNIGNHHIILQGYHADEIKKSWMK